MTGFGLRAVTELRQMSWWPMAAAGFAAPAVAFGDGFLSAVAPWILIAAVIAVPCRTLGDDVQSRRLWVLLTQPVSRRRLWTEKTVVGMSVALLCCVPFVLSGGAAAPWLGRALLAYGVAVLLILWIGHALYAFIAGLCLVSASTLGIGAWAPDGASLWEPVAGLLLIAWGYRTFVGLEATALKNPTLSWARAEPGRRSPVRALVDKELQLLAGGRQLMLAITAPALLALTPFGPPLILASVWALFLVCPMVIGVLTVAEERRLGVSPWQASLPPAQVLHWRVKVAVSFVSALLSILSAVISGWASELGLGLIYPPMPLLAGFGIFTWICGLLASRESVEPLRALGWASAYATAGVFLLFTVIATQHLSPSLLRDGLAAVALAALCLWTVRRPRPLGWAGSITRRVTVATWVALSLGAVAEQWWLVRGIETRLDEQLVQLRGVIDNEGGPLDEDATDVFATGPQRRFLMLLHGSLERRQQDPDRVADPGSGLQLLQAMHVWSVAEELGNRKSWLTTHPHWARLFSSGLEESIEEIDDLRKDLVLYVTAGLRQAQEEAEEEEDSAMPI